LKQKGVNHALTLSNTPTVGESTKPILINAHSEGTASTENGTLRNTPKFVTTDSNQSTFRRVTYRKYDFEKSQSPFTKRAEKPPHCQHYPRDSDTL